VGILASTDRPHATAIVAMGYWGVEIEVVCILRSVRKRGIPVSLKALIERRREIEPTIRHMKMDE
jgi:hypothetical protein